MDIFETFYPDDVEVSSEGSQVTIRGTICLITSARQRSDSSDRA
jgi:hypothetical protein